MFACFGIKSKNKSKTKSKKDKSKGNNSNSNSDDENNENNDEENQKELHEEYTKLKIKCECLQIKNETMQRESLFLDSLIREYKINLHHFENEAMNDNSNDTERSIEKFLKNEYDTLQAKHELLTADNHIIQGEFIEEYNELEKLSNPQLSEKFKLETKKFLLENIKAKNQSTLDYLTNKLNLLKKNKKGKGSKLVIDDIFLTNNDPNGVDAFNFQNNKNVNSSGSNSSSSDAPKFQNRGYYTDENNRELIRKILSETLEYSRGKYQKIYKANIDENSKFDDVSKKIEEIKKEIESIKNPQSANAISTEVKSPIVKNEENKENKELKEKREELQKNKAIIFSLLNEIDNTKKENESLEKGILNNYNVLSDNFSSSVKLEKQLERIRASKRELNHE